MSPSSEERLWGEPMPSIAAVEHDLARARRAEDAHAREMGGAPARTAVLNLVVVATREVHARRAAAAIAGLALRHPSRAIVVLTDRTGGGRGGGGRGPRARSAPHLNGTPAIELRCGAPRARPMERVCFEQILLRARGDADALVTSAVTPLLIADLPVFVWWTETPPLDAERFAELTRVADRLIVDSADFARPEETLPRLHDVGRSVPGRQAQRGTASDVPTKAPRKLSVTDFNWTRLTPWRELVTQFFDVPSWRPYLDTITGLRVGFGVDADGREIHPSQALLLIGWLASRLGWRPSADPLAPSEAGGLLFSMRRADGARIRVRVRPRFELGLAEGDLSTMRIVAETGGHRAEFLLRRANAHATAITLVDDAVVAERTVPLPMRKVDDLLAEELTIIVRDRIYEEALAALVALS